MAVGEGYAFTFQSPRKQNQFEDGDVEIVTDIDDDENITHDPRANSEGPVIGSSISNFNHTPPSTPPRTISAPFSKLDQPAKRAFSDRTSTSPSTSGKRVLSWEIP